MKRDDDYLRELLFRMESEDDYDFANVETLSMDNETRKERYHLLLMEDAGLITQLSSEGSFFRLTNNGHDYISAIRDDTVWNRTKKVAADAGVTTLGVMFEIAVGFGKKKVAEMTGLKLQ